MRAGGYRLAEGFISPLDLVELGLIAREEAEELEAKEKRRYRRVPRSA